MNMIGHENPGMYCTVSLADIFCKSFKKMGFILVFFEDWGFIYPTDYDVMECSGCVKAGLSRHEPILSKRARVSRERHN